MPMPGRLKNPPPAGVPRPGLPGWVMVRLNGCAAFGAVEVLGGAENVRAPREPELTPPPIRASAGETADDQRQRQRQNDGDRLDDAAGALREFHVNFLKSPAGGSAPNMGSVA